MPRPAFELEENKHIYSLDGEIYPSVTQIISATVPKQLAWWGMQVACDGIALLMDRGEYLPPVGPELVTLLTEKKLTTNHQMHTGASRGKEVHNALANYAITGNFNLGDFSIQARKYAVGLLKWLIENDPEIIESEVVTGSIEHRYAGTFDMKVRLRRGKNQGAYVLFDLKTGKRVYPDQHFPQLEAYEQAELESGEEPTDYRAVLHLTDNGEPTVAKSCDSFSDFEVLLNHYHSIEKRKVRMKELRASSRRSETDSGTPTSGGVGS